MKQTSFEAILNFVRVHGRARPVELMTATGNSRTMIQRALKRLVSEGKLEKVGAGPRIFYVHKETPSLGVIVASGAKKVIERSFVYVTPAGQILNGYEGFISWVRQTKQEQYLDQLAEEYLNTRVEANKHITSDGWIDGTAKIQNTFADSYVDKLYFKDFYSLPKFGKTRLGQLMMLAKTSGVKDLIAQVTEECKPVIEKLVALYEIDAVGFIPHSVPRLVQFNTEFKKNLRLGLPEIQLRKAYSGVPVQQKSLGRLEERRENARKTIFVEHLENRYKNVLLIDDAVGSGATMNEVAKKLKDSKIAQEVICFGVVGSLKGFDVVPVV